MTCKNKLLINADINNMRYNIVDDIADVSLVSGRITNNNQIVCSLYNQYNSITGLNNYTVFINKHTVTYFNDGIKLNIHSFENTRDNVMIYYTLYYEFKLRSISDYNKRIMVNSLRILCNYMNAGDFSRFIVALGKDAVLPGL
jgi:hypothetical protein